MTTEPKTFDETLKDIQHSCEVIDGARKIENHVRKNPDILETLGKMGMEKGIFDSSMFGGAK